MTFLAANLAVVALVLNTRWCPAKLHPEVMMEGKRLSPLAKVEVAKRANLIQFALAKRDSDTAALG